MCPEPNANRWQLEVGFLTDVGLHRERNEDAYHVFLPYAGEENEAPVDAVFAVADGMGGHEAGDVAGQFVAHAVQQELAVPGAPSPEDLEGWLRDFMRRVNDELCRVASEGHARTMGSTLTLAVLRDGHVHIGHVGDSRCYRLANGRLEQMTQDHSWVAHQLREGLITPEEAETHPDRNLLTQCLGVGSDLEAYVSKEPIEPNGRYLLCSDGLHGLVGDAVIERVLLEESDAQAATSRLVALALEAGGHDNVTVVVFDAHPNADAGATTPGMLSSTIPGVEAPAETLVGAEAPGRPGGALMVVGGVVVGFAALIGGWFALGPAAAEAPGPADPPAIEAPAASEQRATEAAAEDAPTPTPADTSAAGLADSLISILEPTGGTPLVSPTPSNVSPDSSPAPPRR